MIFSQSTEYALRAVVYLASSQGEARTTQAIAEVAKVPPDYLSKILQSLRKAGIVSSQRGLRGGFLLAKPATEIRLLEVVNAIDPVERIRTCPLKLKSHGSNLCALHRTLDLAIASVELALSAGTIEELLNTPSPSRPLCEHAQGG
jgi:Rrf2 family protein